VNLRPSRGARDGALAGIAAHLEKRHGQAASEGASICADFDQQYDR
jgi:hypothetical protein